MVWECLLIYLVVGTFRKCTGGAHAPSLLGCILTSLLTIGAMAGLARYLLAPRLTPLTASLCLLAFVWIWWIIIRRVPVDSPNKPIRRPEKIRRLRRQSFVYAGVCTLAWCRNGGSILAAAPADDGAERICFADSRPLLAVVYPYGSCRIAVVPPWG